MKRSFALALAVFGLAACQPDPGYHRQYGSYPSSSYGGGYQQPVYGYQQPGYGYQQPRYGSEQSRYDQQRKIDYERRTYGYHREFCGSGSRSRDCVRAPETTPPTPGP